MADAANAAGFLRDLALRALVAAVVGAVISAGVVYFAFDQALRGVETAITVTNERLGGIERRLESMDGRLGAMDGRLSGIEGVLIRAASRNTERDENLVLLSRSARETLEVIEALQGQLVAGAFNPELISQIGGLRRVLEDLQATIERRRDIDG